MDDPLLQHYLTELHHVRHLIAEFAANHPREARQLQVRPDGCHDPFVERMIEAFAYMSARVLCKADAQYPRFTQQLSDAICPTFTMPVPSMTIVRLSPGEVPAEAWNLGANVIRRGTEVYATTTAGTGTRCTFRTAHDVGIWPLRVTGAVYQTANLPAFHPVDRDELPTTVKATIRIGLATTSGAPLSELGALDRLGFYLHGDARFQLHLYKQVFADALGVAVDRSPVDGRRHGAPLDLQSATSLQPVGFDRDQRLLLDDPRTFQGHRLLQEYFAFRQRFLFVDVTGLSRLLKGCGPTAELVLPLSVVEPEVQRGMRAGDRAADGRRTPLGTDGGPFIPFCTPAVNLFKRNGVRVKVSNRQAEYRIDPDPNAPNDFEVVQVERVRSFDGKQEFSPFYATPHVGGDRGRHFSLNRVPSQRRRRDPRSGALASGDYAGSDVYISLVDAADPPFSDDLTQLQVDAVCSNRDLPLHLDQTFGAVDLAWEHGGVVRQAHCLGGVSRPHPTVTGPDTAWSLISSLTLNYRSLADTDVGGAEGGTDGAVALRELLQLYAPADPDRVADEVRAVRCVGTRACTVAVPPELVGDWHRAFARALEVRVVLADEAFTDGWAYLFGSVLDRFFARYASINSFTRTVICRRVNGKETEQFRWQPKQGRATTI